MVPPVFCTLYTQKRKTTEQTQPLSRSHDHVCCVTWKTMKSQIHFTVRLHMRMLGGVTVTLASPASSSMAARAVLRSVFHEAIRRLHTRDVAWPNNPCAVSVNKVAKLETQSHESFDDSEGFSENKYARPLRKLTGVLVSTSKYPLKIKQMVITQFPFSLNKSMDSTTLCVRARQKRCDHRVHSEISQPTLEGKMNLKANTRYKKTNRNQCIYIDTMWIITFTYSLVLAGMH